MLRYGLRQLNFSGLTVHRYVAIQNQTKEKLHTNTVKSEIRKIQKRVWLLPITERNVRTVLHTLKPSEKQILKKALLRSTVETQLFTSNEQRLDRLWNKLEEQINSKTEQITEVKPIEDSTPTKRQLTKLFFHAGLPYFIFGYLDNFLMIIFGDFFDGYLMPLGYSSLASAALGNTLSDMISVFLATYIEKILHHVLSLDKLGLTESQLDSDLAKRITQLSKTLCIGLGTIVGMWPLYFLKK